MRRAPSLPPPRRGHGAEGACPAPGQRLREEARAAWAGAAGDTSTQHALLCSIKMNLKDCRKKMRVIVWHVRLESSLDGLALLTTGEAGACAGKGARSGVAMPQGVRGGSLPAPAMGAFVCGSGRVGSHGRHLRSGLSARAGLQVCILEDVVVVVVVVEVAFAHFLGTLLPATCLDWSERCASSGPQEDRACSHQEQLVPARVPKHGLFVAMHG